jgi:hypothetical protein
MPKLDAGATTVDKLDAQFVKLPGNPVTPEEISAAQTPYVTSSIGELSPEEMAMARQA